MLGYCLAPLLLASILSFFFHAIYIRAPVSFLAVGWAVWGTSSLHAECLSSRSKSPESLSNPPCHFLVGSERQLPQGCQAPTIAPDPGRLPALSLLLRVGVDDSNPVIVRTCRAGCHLCATSIDHMRYRAGVLCPFPFSVSAKTTSKRSRGALHLRRTGVERESSGWK